MTVAEAKFDDHIAYYEKYGSFRSAAKAAGMSESGFRMAYNKKAGKGKKSRRVAKSKKRPTIGTEEVETDEQGDKQSVVTRSGQIRTVADALAKAEVDLTEWRVTRSKVNHWEVGAKDDTGTVRVTPLWQVTVWLEKIQPGESLEDFRNELLGEIRKVAKLPPKPKYKKNRSGLLYEPSIYDHHFGKLCWVKETGENYDLDIAERLYTDAVYGLLNRVQHEKLERILFPVGNDILHTDNAHNTTHRGTPQDVDGRWQKAFMVTRRAVTDAINILRQVAPVDVVVVPGNHDVERAFYLGEVIDAEFSKDRFVNVDNRPTPRKYYQWGNTAIGLSHGDDDKMIDLPLLMADEEPQMWAATNWHEWHLGHIHTKQTVAWNKRDDTHGRSIVRRLPSLTRKDAYHNRKGYRSPNASEAYLWCRDESLQTYATWSPQYN